MNDVIMEGKMMRQIIGPALAMILALGISAGHQAQAEVSVTQTRFKNLKAVTLDSPTLSVTVLPDRGANIISIKDKQTGREWMWQNPYVDYKLPAYAADYMEYDVSGFDDCFPTVGESSYPDRPWKETILPDHGELWSLPWDYIIGESQVTFRVHGIRLPYEFEKTVKLVEPDKIELSYKVTNPTPMSMKAAWAGHALVAIEPGIQVFLPDDTRFQDPIKPWKTTKSDGLLWMKLGGPETASGLKVFTKTLTSGFGGFLDPKTGSFFAMMFSPKELPYIGLWIDQGLLLDDKNVHYNAGVEPSDGGEDYAFSAARKMLHAIPPKSTKEWKVTILIGTASADNLYERITAGQAP